eukprot:Skav211135  [mRNA]  locus=scaffold4091:29274:31664:- [translate_table: standard]
MRPSQQALKAEPNDKPKKKTKKVAKDSETKNKKASFKRTVTKSSLKADTTPKMEYGGYDISFLPKEALPDLTRTNQGAHSYTLNFEGCVEVLLQKQAYYVKRVGEHGSGPKGQVSWAKNGGAEKAFEIAKQRAGLVRCRTVD